MSKNKTEEHGINKLIDNEVKLIDYKLKMFDKARTIYNSLNYIYSHAEEMDGFDENSITPYIDGIMNEVSKYVKNL